MHAYELFYAEVAAEMSQSRAPADRLAAMARGYVRFAAASRPLFEVLYEAGLDKADRAVRATLALIESRHLLGRTAVPHQNGGSARHKRADPPF